MQYYRCKCGEHESYSSMGVPACRFCPKCGTTLAQGPNGHGVPRPHDLITVETRTTYRGNVTTEKVVSCCDCHDVIEKTKDLTPVIQVTRPDAENSDAVVVVEPPQS